MLRLSSLFKQSLYSFSGDLMTNENFFDLRCISLLSHLSYFPLLSYINSTPGLITESQLLCLELIDFFILMSGGLLFHNLSK